MDFQPGEFFIVKVGNKNRLVRYSEEKSGVLHGTIDNSKAEDTVEPVEFHELDVVANLGLYPAIGSAYGVQVEPLLKTVDCAFGPLDFYFRPPEFKKYLAKFNEQVDIVYDTFVTDQKLSHAPFRLESRIPKGKYAGFYIIDGRTDQQYLRLKAKDILDIPHIMYHELGHMLWANYLQDAVKLKTRWYTTFLDTCTATETNKSQTRTLLDSFIQSGISIEEFEPELSDEDLDIFQSCLDHIVTMYRLTKPQLKSISRSGAFEDVIVNHNLWPKLLINVEFDPVVSEYGTKNPEEFWCESLSIYLSGGGLLPQHIDDLVEKTLRRAR